MKGRLNTESFRSMVYRDISEIPSTSLRLHIQIRESKLTPTLQIYLLSHTQSKQAKEHVTVKMKN